MQVAAAAVLVHQPLKALGGFDRNMFILCAENNKRGRRVGIDVIDWGNCFPVLTHQGIPETLRAVVKDGVKKHQRLRAATDGSILPRFVKRFDQRRRRRNMSTSRSTACHDSGGINPQLGSMGAHPAHRRFPVFHALFRRGSEFINRPVLHGNGDHAAQC